jgi:copper chaperone CopZ
MQKESKSLKEIKEITDLIVKEIKEVKGDTKVESNLSNKVELKKQLKEMGIKVVAGNYIRKKDIKKVFADNKTASDKQRTDAMLLGFAAHENGLSCIPSHDKKLMDSIKGLTGLGASKPLLDSWIKGWHKAANYNQKAA